MSTALHSHPSSLTAAAIALGLPVFPCGNSKKPCISKNEGGRGFLDATNDPVEVERLFSHRGARLIGVPTGHASGIDVLDLDYRNGAKPFEDANAHRLPETRIHQTTSGGRHLVFLHAPGVRNSASSIAPGVDVRGEGGYIVVPPSDGYTLISNAEPCHWPDWLLEMVLPKPEPIRAAASAKPRQPVSSAYLDAIIDNALAKVRAAPDGKKHFILRNQALLLGGIQHHAGFSDSEAIRWMMDALPSSAKDQAAAEETAAWGIENGKARPMGLEGLSSSTGHSAPPNAGDEPPPHPGYDGPEAPEDIPFGEGAPKAAQGKKSEQHGTGLPNLLDAPAFMASFTNPDYLVDGIIQRGRLLALTSATGHGKTAVALYLGSMIATGQNIGNIEITQGEVVFLAGENPDDLCGRFHAACQFYGIAPADLPIRVMPGNFPMTPEAAETLKQALDSTGRPIALIIGDSAAAYFPGDDENHNVQMGAYARNLRVLTGCKGNPAVLALCHPVKAVDREKLLPRGGGAFLAELDANLTLWSAAQGETTTLHWQGKIRGVDFQPVNFVLKPVKLHGLVDAKGRPFVSVVAALQTEEQAETATKQTLTDENTVLEWLRRHPGITIRDIALNTGWVSDTGTPNKAKVHRLLKSLSQIRLAVNHRGKWKITDAGKAELTSLAG